MQASRGKGLRNKDGTVCRRYWLKVIKLTHTHMHTKSVTKMFVSLVLQGKLQITPRAGSQSRGLPSTLTEIEQKTKQEVFWTNPHICSCQINNPKSVFSMLFSFFLFFFDHLQIEFGACSLVTIIFNYIISSLSISFLLSSQLFLVLAAIRDLMTIANLALSCFMVIAVKQPAISKHC